MREEPLGPLLIPDPQGYDPALSLKFKAPSRRREAPKSLGDLFYLLEGSKMLRDGRRDQALLHAQVLGCRHHSHPHSTCPLLHPWEHPQLSALPAVPFFPRQQR